METYNIQCGLYLYSFLNLIPVPLPLSFSLNMVFLLELFVCISCPYLVCQKHLLVAVCTWDLPTPTRLVAQTGHEPSSGSALKTGEQCPCWADVQVIE